MLREAALFLDFNLHEGFKFLEMLRKAQTVFLRRNDLAWFVLRSAPSHVVPWNFASDTKSQWTRKYNHKSEQFKHTQNLKKKNYLYLWALLLLLILLHDKEPASSDGERRVAAWRPCNTMWYRAIPYNTTQYHAIQCDTIWYHMIPNNTR